jgi:spore maturation protein CgeB
MPRAARYSVALRNSIREPLFGLEMMKALARAKIGFNIHVDAAGKYAGNIRLFEVTGAGSCLVTDWKQNLHELFDIDKEIVTYSSAPECLEKVTWLLNHPAKRKAIAAAGRARTLSHHSFEVRSRQLNAIIEENFK